MINIYLSTGSNKGDRLDFLKRAFHEISTRIGEIEGYSSIYETEPWGFLDDSFFLNQVVKVKTMLEPEVLLEQLLEIEKSMGRVRQMEGYQSRSIDIDILFYHDWVVKNDKLQLPHPRIQERRFVLIPLAELDPEMIHPSLHLTTFKLLERCTDNSLVEMKYHRKEISSLFGIQ